MPVHLDPGLGEKFRRQRIVIVRENDNASDPGDNQGFGAGRAGHVRDICAGPFNRMPVLGRLDERVHFRVDGAHAVIVNKADLIADTGKMKFDPEVPVFYISALSGEGMDKIVNYLSKVVESKHA